MRWRFPYLLTTVFPLFPPTRLISISPRVFNTVQLTLLPVLPILILPPPFLRGLPIPLPPLITVSWGIRLSLILLLPPALTLSH
ncbi:MAG: hypothetical protein [Inoviridae sp.]|nr:MAG: hypothetical protein [Inoviridae sp.]